MRKNTSVNPSNPVRAAAARWLPLLGVLAAPFAGAATVVDSPDALRTAMQSAVPGDTFVVADGIYEAVTWMIVGEGTEEAPITVRAETPGRVISTGRSAMRIGGEHLVIDGFVFTEGGLPGSAIIEFRTGGTNYANHTRLTRCAIVNNNIVGARTHYVSLYGRHNRVDHCYFAEHNQNGVTLVVWLPSNVPDGVDEAVYHRVDNNHFADRIDGGENGWETIRIGDSQTSLQNARVVVEENLFSRCDGEIEIISNKSGENIYRNNTFYHSQGTLTLRHGDRCVVDGNYFLGGTIPRTGGIRVIGEDHLIINNYIAGTTGRDGAAITVYTGVPDSLLNEYFAAHNAVIAFNTFYLVQGPYLDLGTGLGSRDRTVLPENVVFANNVMIAGTLTTGVFVSGEDIDSHHFEGNFYEGRALGRSDPAGFTEAALHHTFVDGIQRPRPISPVVGAAVGEYPEVTEDIDGQPRTEPKDAGFDQLSDAPVTRRGWLTPADVGPDWIGEDRDMRFVTWLRAELFFGDRRGEAADGALVVDALGALHVDLFPWVYHSETGGWWYVGGAGGETFWAHDDTLGWLHILPDAFPWMYSADLGWLYHASGTAPARLLWQRDEDTWFRG